MLVARSGLSYYPEAELEVQERQKYPRKKIKKRQKREQKDTNSSVKLIYLFLAIIFLGTCLFVLSRYADITSVRIDITSLEKEKMELEKIKLNSIAELEGIKSSKQIAEDAVLKLGMDYPTEGQVIYISVRDSNSNKGIEKLNIRGQIKKVFNMVASLF